MGDTLAVLYDHYKDTCGTIADAIRRRERLMLLLIGALGLFAFQTAFPTETNLALSEFLSFKFGFTLSVGLSVVETVIWFIFLILMVRYFQTVALIERRYTYIHQIEVYLNKHLDGEFITREGKAYSDEYPLFSRWTTFLYAVVFPVLLLGASIAKITYDWVVALPQCPPSVYLILDSIAFVLVAISIVLYMTMIHWPSKPSEANTPPTEKS